MGDSDGKTSDQDASETNVGLNKTLPPIIDRMLKVLNLICTLNATNYFFRSLIYSLLLILAV